jgi:hypothetical protein
MFLSKYKLYLPEKKKLEDELRKALEYGESYSSRSKKPL